MTSQWAALGIFALIIAGLLYAFVRKGTTIRSDSEHKGRSDQGGQPMV